MEQEKQILKLFFNIAITIIIPLLIIPICITIKPAKFLDEEAAYYLENKDFENENDGKIRILIMGDSCGKADWIPELLGEAVYNYSLGGAGPIDEYYTLENYLEKNEAPEYVMYTMSSWYFRGLSALWVRTVYFHRLEMKNILDLERMTKKQDAYSVVGTEHILLKYLGYRLYLPKNYSKAFFSGLFSNARLENNTAQYKYAREGKGHVLYGKAEEHDELTPFFAEHFEYQEFLAAYLCRTIELCEKHNIKFIFQSPPLNPCSHKAMSDACYLEEYTAFLESIQKKYPSAQIETEILSYDADCFGDVHHLNAKGAERFTKQMKEKYSGIFEETKGGH